MWTENLQRFLAGVHETKRGLDVSHRTLRRTSETFCAATRRGENAADRLQCSSSWRQIAIWPDERLSYRGTMNEIFGTEGEFIYREIYMYVSELSPIMLWIQQLNCDCITLVFTLFWIMYNTVIYFFQIVFFDIDNELCMWVCMNQDTKISFTITQVN